MALPVNFKDDVLASSMDGKRRYNMITNSDGTVSFEDVTTYSQEGSNFGSAQINNTNGAINTINNNVLDTIEEISANTSGGKFAGALALKNVNNSFVSNIYVGKDGKLHKVQGGADSVLPFSSSIKEIVVVSGMIGTSWSTLANIKNNYFVAFANDVTVNNNSEYFNIADSTLSVKKACNILKFDNNGITEKKYSANETIFTVNWNHGSYIAIVK